MNSPDPSRPAFAVFTHTAQKATASVEQRLRELGDEAAFADRVGLDYIFTTEHHFSKRFSLLPSQGVSLTVLVQRTERIRIGSMIYVLPLNNPLRVAEETTILDHMSGGRLEVGFGRGIRPHEHDAYGVVTQDDREMTVEAMQLILKAWTSEDPFSWNGRYYHHYGIDMPWRPLQLTPPASLVSHHHDGDGEIYRRTGVLHWQLLIPSRRVEPPMFRPISRKGGAPAGDRKMGCD